MAGDNDLFGDSSSDDADTDDLIAAAKSQPIAHKKDGGGTAAAKKKSSTQKKTPDADNDDDDDDDDESDFGGGNKDDDDEEEAGLFDSSSEDEGPKKKKLGKKKKAGAAAAGKKKAAAAAAKKRPAKKDTRSKKERMEALAKKRAGGDDSSEMKKPRKKRAKTSKEGEGGEKKKEGEDGYESYDSADFQRTKEDDDFIDADDEDPDALKELYSEQHFAADDEAMEYDSDDERTKKKKKSGGGSRKSGGGGGLDKISLSDDEDGKPSATSALKDAVKRMQRKKKEVKKLSELEEEGTVFLKLMDEAADADDECIANRKPALKRLGMLQQVMDMLARKDMVRVLLDLDLLSVVKRWVQPLPNGTLGNVTLRRRIIESIANMTGENGVNAHDLKQSGFGKTVMQLYMHKSETPEMKRLLKSTIEQWSRPIFQKSGNMRDLERAQMARVGIHEGSLVGIARAHAAEAKNEERRKSGGGDASKRGSNEDDLAEIISSGSKATAGEAGNNRVRVPYSKGFQYSVRPESKSGYVGDKRNLVSAKAAQGGVVKDGDRREALGKRMIQKSRKTNKQTQRSANISIEGRAVK